MKLLITTDNFLPRWDGIARFLAEIIPRLKDYDITIVAPDYGRARMKGVKIVQIPLSNRVFGDYKPARYEPKIVEEHVKDADIIFNQALGPIGLAAIRKARKHKKPIISFTHSIEWELFPRAVRGRLLRAITYVITERFVRRYYNRCTALITPSQHTADQLSWHRITSPKRVAHLGVDTKRFTPSSKEKAREKLNIPKKAYVIGYHGRIAPEKNLLTLLRAFLRADIKDKKLLIVGDGDPRIRRTLEEKGAIVTGSKDDVRPYLDAMDCYVLPSFTETTSLSVLEAMAMGLPVISSRVGYIGDYLKHKKNGLFFHVLSSYDLSKKLLMIKSMDRKEREGIKAAARATVRERFDWDVSAQKIDAILKEFSIRE